VTHTLLMPRPFGILRDGYHTPHTMREGMTVLISEVVFTNLIARYGYGKVRTYLKPTTINGAYDALMQDGY